MADAPSILDYLCDDCRVDFDTVKDFLDKLKVAYVIDKRLVRGLDYYARTTFEMQTGVLGAQSAVAGGGRYDGLVKLLGGPDQPATGFAIGLDRLAEIVGSQQAAPVKKPPVYVAALGEKGQHEAFQWICRFGMEGINVEMDFGSRSLKAQMKRADRLGAAYVLIVGENELSQGSAILRNMATKEQVEIPIDNIVNRVKEIISNRG